MGARLPLDQQLRLAQDPPAYGRGEQAQEHLTTAMTMYREMGMTYWLEEVQREIGE